MTTNPLPDPCQCGGPITRRSFLKTTVSGAALAAAGSLPLVKDLKAAQIQSAAVQALSPETLVATLYKSLTEVQRKTVAFPFDHPLRSKVDNNWHITDKKIAEFFTQDQQ